MPEQKTKNIPKITTQKGEQEKEEEVFTKDDFLRDLRTGYPACAEGFARERKEKKHRHNIVSVIIPESVFIKIVLQDSPLKPHDKRRVSRS